MSHDSIYTFNMLKQKITDNIKQALKSGDALRLSTLRMLSAAIANKEIELRKKDMGLSDDEIIPVINSELKKRKDAAVEYKKGGREESAKKEESEAAILKGYLPPEMPDKELREIVKKSVAESGAQSQKDFGKTMKLIMPQVKGRADGNKISQMLKEELTS